MLREYLNVMGHSEERERLEHISTQLQHTRTKEQVLITAKVAVSTEKLWDHICVSCF